MAQHINVQTLIPLLFLIALISLNGVKVHSQFSPPLYQGDARVLRPTSFNTSLAGIDGSGNKKADSVGRFVYSDPVQFWTPSPAMQLSFTTTFRFVITPSTFGAAEGVAFFIAPVGTTIPEGSERGHLGIYGSEASPSIFAVEFDTKVDLLWDPIYRHVGINIENRSSSNVTAFDAGTGEEVTAIIRYVSRTRTITVAASTATRRAELSYVFDLKTIFPGQLVQMGVTAATGRFLSTAGLSQMRSLQVMSSLDPDN